MKWRHLQQRCSLPLYLALQGALELAEQEHALSIDVHHLLRAMLASPATRPRATMDGQDMNLARLFAALAQDTADTADLPKGAEEMQTLEPGPNGSSHDNWNEDANADGHNEDLSGWINKR